MEIFESIWKSPPKTPEQRLWVAVLQSALEDALNNRDPFAKESAKRWFKDGGRNFRLVCDLANFDYGFVQKQILSIIK